MIKVLKKARLDEFFDVKSGDFHATKELDRGEVPLISCGDAGNGLIGYFAIPTENQFRHCITVAYNGWPLTAKFHPYRFGAKDDVAVLLPKKNLEDTTLFYFATLLNRIRWRYSYNRKCFREKLRAVTISVPINLKNGKRNIDEAVIARIFPDSFRSFIPKKMSAGKVQVPNLTWRDFNLLEVLSIDRGDFHSIDNLDHGKYMTVSRVSDDCGVVGYFDCPEGAKIYSRGKITVSTVGGDAFVQLDEFIATDNVIICTPRKRLRMTSLFFMAFMLNQQKWRYSYGRQCYKTKLARAKLYLPVAFSGGLDEEAMQHIVEQTSYWHMIKRRF